MNKIYYDWNDIDRAVTFLSSIIKMDNLHFISGVPRGGLVLAVMLSHRLGLKYIPIHTITEVVPYKKTLVVDDIYDSGETLDSYKEKGFVTLSIDKKITTVSSPDYFSYIVNKNDWVVYPWES